MTIRKANKLRFWGASPKIFFLTLCFAVPVIIINTIFRAYFKINFIPGIFLLILSIVLLIAGIPLYIFTVKKIKSAFKQNILLTGSIFAFCRNPLFAVVIFMILSGIILLFRSWLLLTIPVFMYAVFTKFIKEEEALMAERFGQAYIDYMKKVPALFPLIIFANKK